MSQEARRRTRMSPEQRRAQLVALGVAALADRPLEAVTIEDLARQAGVSPGLVHHYFGSRNGLHHEVLTTARDSMLRATEPRYDLPPVERVRDTLERFVEFVRAHERVFFSLVRGSASGATEVRDVVDHARLVLTDHLERAAAELGFEVTPQVRVLLRACVAMAEQALLDAAPSPEVDPAELADTITRSMLAVVQATAAPPPQS